jgi:integral membrane protein
MPATPRRSDAPRIRGALRLYRVTSLVTGTFLLLLVLMMVFRYGFGVDIEVGGPFGFLALTPKEAITAINFSTVILIVHGWLYVIYLYSDFRLWSLARWPLWKFGVVALGGVIPFLSFPLERAIHRQVEAQLTELEAPVEAPVD